MLAAHATSTEQFQRLITPQTWLQALDFRIAAVRLAHLFPHGIHLFHEDKKQWYYFAADGCIHAVNLEHAVTHQFNLLQIGKESLIVWHRSHHFLRLHLDMAQLQNVRNT